MLGWSKARLTCVPMFAMALWVPASSGALAQTSASAFYKGKSLTIVTSTGAGGGYDLVARLIARHLLKAMPGIGGVVVQNMPGGGNLRAANYMYEIAPKDGTVIGVVENAIPLKQVLEPTNVRFDVTKFNWIGSTGGHNEVIMAMGSAGIASVEDLKTREVVLGGTGPGSSIVVYPAAMNSVLGTRFKIVTGYTSSSEIYLAMDRGEVVARSGTVPSINIWHPGWVAQGKIRILAQVGLKRDPQMPDIPLISELAATPEQRDVLNLISSPAALGQPYYAPPGVPAERIALLRAAFLDTLREPDLLAEAARIQAEIEPMSGEQLTQIILSVIGAPANIVEKARAAIELKDAVSR